MRLLLAFGVLCAWLGVIAPAHAALEVSGEGRVRTEGRLVVYGTLGPGSVGRVRCAFAPCLVRAGGRPIRLPAGRASTLPTGRIFVRLGQGRLEVTGRIALVIAGEGRCRFEGRGLLRPLGAPAGPWPMGWVPCGAPARGPRAQRPPSRTTGAGAGSLPGDTRRVHSGTP